MCISCLLAFIAVSAYEYINIHVFMCVHVLRPMHISKHACIHLSNKEADLPYKALHFFQSVKRLYN